MIQFFHNLSFVDYRFDFLFSGQFVLPHDLHGVESAGVFLPDKDHPTERTSADDLDLLEVMASHLELGVLFLGECQFGEMCP